MMNPETEAKADQTEATALSAVYGKLREAISRVIVGQEGVVEQILISLLSEGHVLLVGVPGLAKTLIVSTVARILDLNFRRIQFTPDLMPSDITGTAVVAEDPATGQREFRFLSGPVFSNIILADEINRTPPKTQAALMEAMEERCITQQGKRMKLDRPFFVLATQNPIEQEGTYPLPVSQLDRFLFSIFVDYPAFPEEYTIMCQTTSAYAPSVKPVLDKETILSWVSYVRTVQIPQAVYTLAHRLVLATRPKEPDTDHVVKEYVEWGGGPRAAQAVLLASKARAALRGRTTAGPEDVAAVFLPALRHRLVLTYHGRAERIAPDTILRRVLARFGYEQ